MQKALIIGGGVALLLLGAILGTLFGSKLFASGSNDNTVPPINIVGSPSTTGRPYCQQYLQDEAKRLNVSTSTLEQDQKLAFTDTLAQLVKDGKLTQKESTEVNASAASRQACAGLDLISGKGVTLFNLRTYMTAVADQVASGLHMNRTQLVTQLRSGKSLSSIATAQGVSASQLQTIELNAIQGELNKAVSAGDLTSQQAQSILQQWQHNPQLLDNLLKTVS